MNGKQFNIISPSPWVKKLMVANVAIWLIGVVILEGMIGVSYITSYFAFIPELFIERFFIWQPFTYMFLHAPGPMHILFNMISLWFFGSELELRWGSKFFLTYYIVSGVGAALIYLIGMIFIGWAKGVSPPIGYSAPVVGASGAVFGILLAYGVLFGERMIYFFGVFPIKAKYFVLMIGCYELIVLLTSGQSNSVANLAHLGGLITGAAFLFGWTRYQQGKWRKGGARRNLRLVVNKDEKKPGDGPKYWN